MNENRKNEGQNSNPGNSQQGNRQRTDGQQQSERTGQNNPDTADDRGLGNEGEQDTRNRPKDDEGWEGKRKANPDRVRASGQQRRDN